MTKRILYSSVLKKFLTLRSTLAVFVAVFCYTLIVSWIFSPTIKTVSEEDGSLVFLSTDHGEPLRPSIIASIDSSRYSVLLITYTLTDRLVVNALKKAAERGITVTVIYDPVASPEAALLLGKNIYSLPRRKSGLMHQKLLVVDKSIVWIGSANMTATSLVHHGNIMAQIRSPCLAELFFRYADILHTSNRFTEPPLTVHFPQQTLSLFIHPYQGKDSLTALISKIEAAKKRVFVAMYTFTHEAIMKAIIGAKRRGVDVRILFDKDSILQTSQKVFLLCKREGISCFLRKKSGLLHYKVAIIDNSFVLGSANWTKAAFRANDDCLLIIDPLTPSQIQWIDDWWRSVELQVAV